MLRSLSLHWLLALSALPIPCLAQAPRDGERRADEANSARNQVNAGFERTAPKLGELIPDIAGFDAEGNDFRLRSLKGHYSVLVFGCLT
jgi:hypothetical protein